MIGGAPTSDEQQCPLCGVLFGSHERECPANASFATLARVMDGLAFAPPALVSDFVMRSPIVLVWPPMELSGHANGNRWRKSKLTKQFRQWAFAAALSAKVQGVPDKGDLGLDVTFYPPNDRSDRLNYPNRMKAAFDGIAQALRVNDKRFLPTYHYAPPDKRRPRVQVVFDGATVTTPTE